MSWDVILLALPTDARSIASLPEDYEGESLGTTDQVREILRELFPTIDFTDPTWGVLMADEYSIEFSVGEQEPCTSLMLHVRGTEAALDAIARLCQRSKWRAFDTTDGELIDFAGDAGKGLREWIAYRRRVDPDGPLRGVALPIDGKGVVFFDSAPGTPKPK